MRVVVRWNRGVGLRRRYPTHRSWTMYFYTTGCVPPWISHGACRRAAIASGVMPHLELSVPFALGHRFFGCVCPAPDTPATRAGERLQLMTLLPPLFIGSHKCSDLE